ncbi:methyltransferase domain-containing protein [Amycolatopsis acidiphila]|uniref:methyltransferase domain-containing protein n=1 Tax=Amycolatopsis acidiphila TaxID=715473 RepID=UPI0019858BF8|nr:class I SAM-dependent methyltransferase [Amycolatopsis acidiphila]GHG70580.1 hypothetical protein GCM10017788_31750 [Amycolatopsis acidiphila]
MREDHFGEDVADGYDQAVGELFAPPVIEATVGFLAALADGGAALELGIGTGRVALPLSEAGVAVHGIDLSPAMLARLRAKPGAARIGATQGISRTSGWRARSAWCTWCSTRSAT